MKSYLNPHEQFAARMKAAKDGDNANGLAEKDAEQAQYMLEA